MYYNTPEQNKKLIERYPFLLHRHDETDEAPNGYDYSYTLAEYIPVGWYKAFGIRMFEELRELLLESGLIKEYRLFRFSNTFGSITLGDNFGWNPYSSRYLKIINKYEELSRHTCIVCGKMATYMTKGKFYPYRTEHLPKNQPYEPIK